MTIDIVEEGAAGLSAYATVSIAFDVRSVLDDAGLAEWTPGDLLQASPVDAPYRKDYDREPGNHPMEWPHRFDVSAWGFLAAYRGGMRIGGAAVIARDQQIELLEGQPDMALLWDLRVAPDARGVGVGGALLRRAERWALERGARQMRIETQQVNVLACRFYAAHGYALERIRRDMYPALPHEIQLLWHKRLGPPAPVAGSSAELP